MRLSHPKRSATGVQGWGGGGVGSLARPVISSKKCYQLVAVVCRRLVSPSPFHAARNPFFAAAANSRLAARWWWWWWYIYRASPISPFDFLAPLSRGTMRSASPQHTDNTHTLVAQTWNNIEIYTRHIYIFCCCCANDPPAPQGHLPET